MRLQRRVFPKGLIFDKTGFGTPVTHSIYMLLADDLLSEEALVAPQGFEPRLDESESSVLPLNERATQIETAAAGSAGATISRLIECTTALLFPQHFERLLAEDAMTRKPSRSDRQCRSDCHRKQRKARLKVIVDLQYKVQK
jgi:hypothetical protein